MLLDIAIKLLVPIVGGFFLGLYLDKFTSTTPLIAIILAILGIFAGMYLIYKQHN
jgi:F0F1-type ATP synthase assembly protein I